VRRTGRDEPIVVVRHICMETTEGNFLCTYLYLKLAKASCFSFLCFFFKKIGEQDGRTASALGWWGGTCEAMQW
jgi:hypothetical protein